MLENARLNTETAFLVGVQLRGSHPLLSMEDSLRELALLADTAGMKVIGQTSQTISDINPATLVGSGKAQEILEAVKELNANAVIFDDELSPRHQRELAKLLGNEIKLLDRSALILDIFAQHANTREGALQVELAQYEYRLPRLTRQWTHLARQAGGSATGGGVGLRGPGETQLEVDRREISRKIDKLKRDLERVRQQRRQYRQQREKSGIPVIALVGYTNAGKSTLLNRLSQSSVYVADQLFATLDPTTRRIELPSGRHALITDTVGFIQKLPTTLIAAFRATLEETQEANLLLHVVDASHPNVASHVEAVEDTLAEIDIPDVPQLLVWNKIDRIPDTYERPHLEDASGYRRHVMVSAHTGKGVDELLQAIEEALQEQLYKTTLMIPHHRGDLLSVLYEKARVISVIHGEEGTRVEAELPLAIYQRYIDFVVNATGETID